MTEPLKECQHRTLNLFYGNGKSGATCTDCGKDFDLTDLIDLYNARTPARGDVSEREAIDVFNAVYKKRRVVRDAVAAVLNLCRRG